MADRLFDCLHRNGETVRFAASLGSVGFISGAGLLVGLLSDDMVLGGVVALSLMVGCLFGCPLAMLAFIAQPFEGNP